MHRYIITLFFKGRPPEEAWVICHRRADHISDALGGLRAMYPKGIVHRIVAI